MLSMILYLSRPTNLESDVMYLILIIHHVVTLLTSNIVNKDQLRVIHPPLLSLHEYVGQVVGQLIADQLQVGLGFRRLLLLRFY